MKKLRDQEAPNGVQVEMVEGCPLRCDFCGINGIRGDKRTYKYMTLETAEHIAQEMAGLKWTSRLEFAMHGEPTMHPNYLEILKIFRKHLPKNHMLLLTNGANIRVGASEKLLAIFETGVNCIGIDRYTNIPWADEIKAQLVKASAFFYNYPEDGNDANPHRRVKGQRIVFLSPIDTTTSGTHSQMILGNHCGAAAPKDDSKKDKRCARPFRELSFRWDGNVAICCNDFRGE
ncbi:MAG: radical SAM protein, partial [Desulfobacteraceae bacterium]